MRLSKINGKQEYGLLKLSQEIGREKLVCGSGHIQGHYGLRKGFYGLTDNPRMSQHKIDQKMNCLTRIRQDDEVKKNEKTNKKSTQHKKLERKGNSKKLSLKQGKSSRSFSLIKRLEQKKRRNEKKETTLF